MEAESKLEYSFDQDTEGWIGVNGGAQYDKADWLDQDGNGVLQMDGSKFGKRDDKPNGYFFKKIKLPQKEMLHLEFDVKSHSSFNDANLQVEVIEEDNTIRKILPWETIKSADWLKKSIDISEYRGQTLTIHLEQADSGQGEGEYIYIDNLKIIGE